MWLEISMVYFEVEDVVVAIDQLFEDLKCLVFGDHPLSLNVLC